MVEPTRCQHDTLRGAQRADHSVLFCHHTRDTIVIGQQCLHLGFKHQIDFVIEQRLEQATDQRIAHDKARSPRRTAQAIQRIKQQDFESMFERCEFFGEVEQMPDIGAIHHHPTKNSKFRNGWTDQRQRLAQNAAIKRQGLQSAATGCRAFDMLLVIGMMRIGPKMHMAFRLKRCNGIGPTRQKGFTQYRRRVISNNAIEKSPRSLRRVGWIDLVRVQTVGHPCGGPR